MKKKFPKKLIVVLDSDSDGVTPIAFETPEDISDKLADEPIGIYELVAVGKFTVEKQVDAKLLKDKPVDLDNMSHQEMSSFVQKIGLKLYTKNLSTKDLRKTLREYLKDKKR